MLTREQIHDAEKWGENHYGAMTDSLMAVCASHEEARVIIGRLAEVVHTATGHGADNPSRGCEICDLLADAKKWED